jgi:hypothetical protein
MSVRQRLEDANLLAKAGSRDGAFLMVLVAAAATSRKRYPRDRYSDAASFKNFVYDELGVITGCGKYNVSLPFQGNMTPLEDILYKQLRNGLIHEASLPTSIVFTEPEIHEGFVHHALHLQEPFGFPAGWIQRIATAVSLAPENDSLWPDEADKRKAARAEYGELLWDGSYCRRP